MNKAYSITLYLLTWGLFLFKCSLYSLPYLVFVIFCDLLAKARLGVATTKA